jgi:predicted transcriptional regulator
MGGARSRRHGSRSEGPISLHAEILVVHDPKVRERQVKAIRNFLLSLSARVGEPTTSDTAVGPPPARDDRLDALVGPLEADVVRVVWAAKAPLSVRQVLRKLNERRSRPLRYTTVQTVMARLTRKDVLERFRHGRRDQYRVVAPDAPSIAVSWLLNQFGEAVIRPFVQHVSREPRLQAALRAALPHLL